jgi:hypothetical protein
MLGWSAHELATRAGLGYNTVVRAESVDGLPSMRTPNLLAIQQALEKGDEKGSVIFFSAGETPRPGGDGVRLRIALRRPPA